MNDKDSLPFDIIDKHWWDSNDVYITSSRQFTIEEYKDIIESGSKPIIRLLNRDLSSSEWFVVIVEKCGFSIENTKDIMYKFDNSDKELALYIGRFMKDFESFLDECSDSLSGCDMSVTYIKQ